MDSSPSQLGLPLVLTKPCARCGRDLLVDAFPLSARDPSGRQSYCRECFSIYRPKRSKRPDALQVGLGVKQCTKCRKTLPFAHFGRDARRPDGLFPYCRPCRARDPDRYEERQLKSSQGLVRCTACKRWLVAAAFGSNRSNPDGRNRSCRECGVRAFHKRAAAKRSSGETHTVEEWRALKARYDFTCLACGRREPDIKLTEDHVIPLCRGGSDAISNIQPLCLHCNCSKRRKSTDYRKVVDLRR